MILNSIADMGEALPAWPDRLTDDDRRGVMELAQQLVSLGRLDLGQFDDALARIVAATTSAELDRVVECLPAPYRRTPASRRRDEPLLIKSVTQNIRLRGPWQVARETRIESTTGNIKVDLTEAEFDDRVVHLHLKVATGNVRILVPPGVAVQLVGENAAVRSDLAPPLPGYPVIKLSTSAVTGTIRIGHPKPPPPPRWWRRRAGRSAG